MSYLTPPSVTSSYVCRPVRVPADTHWLAIVSGALSELTYAKSFQQSLGGLTPEQTAEVFAAMFYEYLDGECEVATPLVGEVRMVAYNFADSDGWLRCDGRELSRALYADLFAVLGTTWGAGNGTTTFNIPNAQHRNPRAAGSREPVGGYIGSDSTTLVQANLPVNTVISGGTVGGVTGQPANIVRKTTAATPFSIVPSSFSVDFIIFAGVI